MEEHVARPARRRSRRPAAPCKPGPPGRALFAGKSSGEAVTLERPSRGLEEFFKYIRDTSGLTILDLGVATQQNVSFITNLGHRLYAADFLQILNETFGLDDTVDQSNPGQIEYFLKQALDYPEGHFDAVLIWDVLEYLAPALLTAVVERLHQIVRPQGLHAGVFSRGRQAGSGPFLYFPHSATEYSSGGAAGPCGGPRNSSITAAWKSCSASLSR